MPYGDPIHYDKPNRIVRNLDQEASIQHILSLEDGLIAKLCIKMINEERWFDKEVTMPDLKFSLFLGEGPDRIGTFVSYEGQTNEIWIVVNGHPRGIGATSPISYQPAFKAPSVSEETAAQLQKLFEGS